MTRSFERALVALLAAIALLVGWAAPVGSHAATARVAPTTASGSLTSVGHTPAAALRAARTAVVGAVSRTAHHAAVAERTVRTTGGDHPLPFLALLVVTAGLAAALVRRVVPSGRTTPLGRSVLAHLRVRAPPVLAPAAV